MIEIPECKPAVCAEEDEAEFNETVKRILDSLNRQGDAKYKSTVVYTANSYVGGVSMRIIKRVAKAFAEKGYWVYLITGVSYSAPNQLLVQNHEQEYGLAQRGGVRFERVMP